VASIVDGRKLLATYLRRIRDRVKGDCVCVYPRKVLHFFDKDPAEHGDLVQAVRLVLRYLEVHGLARKWSRHGYIIYLRDLEKVLEVLGQ